MWRRFGSMYKRSQDSSDDLYARVQQQLRSEVKLARHRWRQHSDFSYLNELITAAKERAKLADRGSGDTAAQAWLHALVLQAPHAAQAQAQMDHHKHGFRGKAERVLELIDFNDAYVATVLALNDEQRAQFNESTKRLIDWFCKRVGAWTFSNEDFAAIAHGLSREIAVYYAVNEAGFSARMTSRAEDAFGIDMYIGDDATGKRVRVDTKTSSAFHYRLIELFREGRLGQADIELAERNGYTAVINGHGDERLRVILWRIDHGTLGDITNFHFTSSHTLIEELRRIVNEYGESIDDSDVAFLR